MLRSIRILYCGKRISLVALVDHSFALWVAAIVAVTRSTNGSSFARIGYARSSGFCGQNRASSRGGRVVLGESRSQLQRQPRRGDRGRASADFPATDFTYTCRAVQYSSARIRSTARSRFGYRAFRYCPPAAADLDPRYRRKFRKPRSLRCPPYSSDFISTTQLRWIPALNASPPIRRINPRNDGSVKHRVTHLPFNCRRSGSRFASLSESVSVIRSHVQRWRALSCAANASSVSSGPSRRSASTFQPPALRSTRRSCAAS